jgi:F0F1-type ATP synthase membrane subunit b/b'
MRLSRVSIAVYVGLVFASGAVLGAFGHRLYTVSAVSAKTTKRNPEEFRKKIVTEYQQRLHLSDQQVAQLNAIMDETRTRVEETRQKMRPTYDKIHEEQTAKVREMLTPEQRVEYEKMRKEREERQKQPGRSEI